MRAWISVHATVTLGHREEQMDDETPWSAETIAHATPETARAIPGRRAFFTYLDLGVEEASNGAMKAQMVRATQGFSQPTGWHYHECERQFLYMIKGWVDLQFEDGRQIRLNAGETLMIPGGMRHNEIGTSDEMDLLEILVPAGMRTVPCDPPLGMT
jgi:quercetin dioxygenase-like cupin family protein